MGEKAHLSAKTSLCLKCTFYSADNLRDENVLKSCYT